MCNPEGRSQRPQLSTLQAYYGLLNSIMIGEYNNKHRPTALFIFKCVEKVMYGKYVRQMAISRINGYAIYHSIF